MNRSFIYSGTQKRKRSRKLIKRSSYAKDQNLDAMSFASLLQLKEEKREYIYSLIALYLKLGLLALFATSLVKVSFASHQRVRRHFEISSILNYESLKINKLRKRFDSLFTIGGASRLMEEQDRWITPNTYRVIWR